jgi:hypothetical protein
MWYTRSRQAKEKAQNYTRKRNKDAEVVNCRAQVAGKRAREKPYEIFIERSDDLTKIDKVYKQLLERDSKGDIRVYMTYLLDSVDRIDEDDSSSTDEDEFALTQGKTASQARTPVSSKKSKGKGKSKAPRSTATTQLRAKKPANQVRDAASGSRAIEIARNNRCSIGTCPNKGYAYIAYGEHAHIRIDSSILKKWDQAIIKGQATVMEPPRYLVGRLLEGLSARKTMKQDKRAEKDDMKGLVINNYIGGGPAAKELVEPPLRSSPVYFTGDVDQALIDYIEEWCLKRPIAARQFRETLKKLQDETLGFNDLDLIEARDQWPQFATTGVAAALMRERKRFQRDEDTRALVAQSSNSASLTTSEEDSVVVNND